MKLIVGLGNPGPDYERTRHNIGWQVVDAFAAKFRIALDTHEKNAMTGRGRVAGGAVMVAKPLTFMNLSGDAVKLLINGYLESPAEMIVVYDDVDLPIGKLRIRPNGSSGTHNGMRSIVEVLGTEDFPRLRVGVRGERFGENPLRDYVLDDFEPDEQESVAQSVTRAIDALTMFVRDDLKRAMNQFNRDQTPDDNLPKL